MILGTSESETGTRESEAGTRRRRTSGSRLIRRTPSAALHVAVTPTRIIREVTLLVILKIN